MNPSKPMRELRDKVGYIRYSVVCIFRAHSFIEQINGRLFSSIVYNAKDVMGEFLQVVSASRLW